MDWNRKYTTIAIYSFVTVVISIMFIFMLINFPQIKNTFIKILSLISPIIIGIAIAYILNPVLAFTEKSILPPLTGKYQLKPKTKRTISIIITYLFALIIAFVFFKIVIPEVVASITGIGSKISGYVNNADAIINKFSSIIPFDEFPEDIVLWFKNTISSIIESLYKLISSAIPYLVNFTVKFSTGLINFVLGIIISVYVFFGKETFFAQINKVLNAILKPDTVIKLVDINKEAHHIFTGFISGKILDSFIIGILCFIGMSILKIPSAMLVSLIVGVTNVIPYFGPFIGAIPSALIILIDSPMKSLIFLVFVLILQQFDGNILGPKILGDSTGLSAFWVVFAILLFGGLFGVVGMFIGVPTFAVIYSLFRRFISFLLTKKNLPTDTDYYASEENKLL